MSINKMKWALLARMFGNKPLQMFLEKRIRVCQRLSGIGTGGSVSDSGEKGLCNRLRLLGGAPYCIFDVGANKGDFASLVLSSLPAGEIGAIHCFEPAGATFNMLKENVGQHQQVTLNNLALGRCKCDSDLFYDFPGSGAASLTKRDLDYMGVSSSQCEKVHVGTLDDYCSENKIETIDWLKIDVEGHELDVLQGGSGMIKDGRVGMVSFEFGGCHIDTRTFVKDFYHFFEEHGLGLYRLTPSGYLHELPPYSEAQEQFRTTVFVAMNNQHH